MSRDTSIVRLGTRGIHRLIQKHFLLDVFTPVLSTSIYPDPLVSSVTVEYQAGDNGSEDKQFSQTRVSDSLTEHPGVTQS